MQQGASQAEPLGGAGGERANLLVQCVLQVEPFGELGDALLRFAACQVIELTKEEQILAAGEARIKSLIASGVITELAADDMGSVQGAVAGDESFAASRKQESCEDSQQRGFSGAVRTEKSDCFARVHLK